MRVGLREELLGGVGAVALAGMLLLAWLILLGAESAILSESSHAFERDVASLTQAVAEAAALEDAERVRAFGRIAHRHVREGSLRAATILSPGGAVVASSAPPRAAEEARDAEETPSRRVRTVPSAAGAFTVVAEGDFAATLARIDGLRLWGLAFTGLAVLGVVLVGRAALARGVVAPVEALAAATRRIAEGDLSARTAPGRRDEIGELARAFNAMAERLERSRDELLEAERLAAVGRLSAGVAHEVGNPLAALRGNLQLLEREDLSAEERRAVLAGMDRAAERMDRTIGALLGYARPSRGARAPVDLRRAAEAAVSLVRAQPRFAGVRFRIDAAEGLDAVETDADALGQVLVNLLVNAAQAMNGEGEAAVRARRGAESVVLEVEDRGPGVATADAERLFEPFFTTKAAGEGTGLGLALSRRLARDLGGDLALVRAGAPGAVFRLTLPARSLREAA